MGLDKLGDELADEWGLDGLIDDEPVRLKLVEKVELDVLDLELNPELEGKPND